jgi:translation initiation factor 2B subunit (eIF-2B alpha/beta/delta family)
VGNAKAIDYMKQEIHNRIRDIELDRLSGASQLASKALSVLKFLVRTTDKETIEEFLEDFYDTGKRLFELKPNIAPIQNLVGQIVYEVRAKKARNLISLRDFVVSRIDELCRNSVIAAKRVSEYGAEMINDSDLK